MPNLITRFAFHLCVCFLFAFGVSGCGVGTGNINDTSTVPQEPFLAFKKDFEGALNSQRTDLQHQTFHFVLLFNTTRRNGPAFQKARNVAQGLLFHYLQRGDVLSVVPYQSTTDFAPQRWAQGFSPENRLALYESIKPPSGDEDGHDDERALLAASNELQAQSPHLVSNTIFIMVSDKEVSEPSKTHPQSLMTGAAFEAELDRMHVKSMGQRMYSGQGWQVWVTTFAPVPLVPLGSLAFARDIPPDPRVLIGQIVLACLALVLVLTLCYRYWLGRPQGFYLGNNFQKVAYGQSRVISGPHTGSDRLEVPEMPLGQDVARLEVDRRRRLILMGTNQYELLGTSVEGNRTVLQTSPIEYTVIERGGDSIGTITLNKAQRS